MRRPVCKSLATALVVVMMLTAIAGCEREEFDPQATAQSAEVQTTTSRAHQYTVRVEDSTVPVEEETTVAINFLPGPDLKINLEFPWTIKFEPVEGLEFSQESLSAADMELSDEVAVVPMGVLAENPGDYTVRARANFSVCNDDRCDILRNEPIDLVITAH